MHTRTISATAALSIAASMPAAAQTAYCMPGAPPSACFTIELLAQPAPDGDFPTLMTFRVRNLQGSLNSDPSLFGIHFFGVRRTATPPTDEHPYGTDFIVQSALLPLTSSGGPVQFNQPATRFISESSGDPDFLGFSTDGLGIGGCASTLSAGEFITSTIARTCSVQGLTGAVDVSFYIGIFEVATGQVRAVTMDDVSVTIGGQVGNDGYLCAFNGAMSGEPAGTTCLMVPNTTVPEPGTLVLLAAPALALARWGRRRRSGPGYQPPIRGHSASIAPPAPRT